jgi:hypothetical protein
MSDQALRKQLNALLQVRQAHLGFDDAVKDFPLDHINSRPPNVPYTFWHLVDHLRFTQWDILDYIRNPNYQYTQWPAGYWPAPNAETDVAGWQRTLAAFRDDLQALADIINDPATDFHAQIAHGEPGHTILREILVVGSHNAYHIGELGILRQVMGLW